MATLGTSPEGFWSLTQGTRKQHTPKDNKTTKHSPRKEEVQRLSLRGQYHCTALYRPLLTAAGTAGHGEEGARKSAAFCTLGVLVYRLKLLQTKNVV